MWMSQISDHLWAGIRDVAKHKGIPLKCSVKL
jgi:hypothetical protein